MYSSFKNKRNNKLFLIFDSNLVSEPLERFFFLSFFFSSNATMNIPDVEAFGNKLGPIIIQSEGSSFNAGILLNETNYDMWSQIIEMHITEKERLSFIRGTQIPAKKEEGYKKWYVDNKKVKRWLLMSMTPEIIKRYLRLPTAHDIWKALSKAFYDGTNELQVFALNKKVLSAKQKGRTLSVYYGELTESSGELDHRDKVIMESEKDVESYRSSYVIVLLGRSSHICSLFDQSGSL